MSNALKAEIDGKRGRLRRLKEELDMVRKVAMQNQAFEAVYQSIEEDYPPHDKNSFLNQIGGNGLSPEKENRTTNDGSFSGNGSRSQSLNESNKSSTMGQSVNI